MSKIQQYEITYMSALGKFAIITNKKDDGCWVLYADHLAALAEKDREISDAWCLAFNLWPGDKEPSELDLNAVIYELGERYKREIAALTEERDQYRDSARRAENQLFDKFKEVIALTAENKRKDKIVEYFRGRLEITRLHVDYLETENAELKAKLEQKP